MAGEYPQMAAPQGADYGFLGGMFDAKQQQDAIASRELSRQGQGLSNAQQMAATDRYTQETPFSVQQQQGTANSLMATGEIDQYKKKQVMEQKVAEALAGKSEAELKKGAAEAESMVQKLVGAKARYLQAQQLGQGPQAALQIATDFGFNMKDPKVLAQLQPVMNDPEQFQAVLDSYTKSYQAVGQAVAARVEERAKTAATTGATIKGHEISAGATKYAADRSLEAAKYRADHPSNAGGGVKPPKTAQEAVIRDIAQREAEGIITSEEAQIERAQVLAAQQQANRAPTTALAFDDKGRPTGLKEVEKVPAYVPPKAKTQQERTDQDVQALAWANANPNDPRAKAIKAKLGEK